MLNYVKNGNYECFYFASASVSTAGFSADK